MESQPPPIYVIVPGRVYRPDSDATHTPQFHQIEGLAVDEDITLADLKGTLLTFARAIFGARPRGPAATALLPVHRAERRGRRVVLSTAAAASPPTASAARSARGPRGSRSSAPGWSTRTCSARARPAYDPERVQGFAFGMGIERIAMLKHGVPDLRLLYDNDIRFLEQFAMRG